MRPLSNVHNLYRTPIEATPASERLLSEFIERALAPTLEGSENASWMGRALDWSENGTKIREGVRPFFFELLFSTNN